MEVYIVENVWVLVPSSLGTLLVLSAEADCEGAHESDELLWRKIALSKSLRHKTASVRLSCMLDNITFGTDVFSAHIEDHGRASAILNSCISSQLKQI